MDLVFDGLIRPQGNQLRANWRTVAAVWLFRLAGNSMTGGRSASGLRLEWFSLRNNESPPGVASGVPIAAPGLSCDYPFRSRQKNGIAPGMSPPPSFSSSTSSHQ